MSKDTPEQGFCGYTITADGQFLDENDRPLRFNGDLDFYACSMRSGWWEYRAKFIDGRLNGISLIEFTPPETDQGIIARVRNWLKA